MANTPHFNLYDLKGTPICPDFSTAEEYHRFIWILNSKLSTKQINYGLLHYGEERCMHCCPDPATCYETYEALKGIMEEYGYGALEDTVEFVFALYVALKRRRGVATLRDSMRFYLEMMR